MNKKKENIFIKALDDRYRATRFLSISFMAGFIFPVLSWYMHVNDAGADFNIFTILEAHSTNSALYIADMAPVVLTFFSYLFLVFMYKENEKYIVLLREKEEKIQKNAQFAKLIGEGDFSSNVADIDKDDTLTKSLLRMRDNLVKNSQKETEQNWIATGRDKISTILRLHNNLEDLAYDTLKSLIEYINAIQGAFYFFDEEQGCLQNLATYAYNRKKFVNQTINIGEGLVGQAAYEMDVIYRTEIPEEYVSITSGILGEQKPSTLLIVPLISDEKLQGVIEFASLDESIDEIKITFVEQLSSIIAQTVFNLRVNARTEKLLADAQTMTEELKENEEQLRQNAEEMRATHDELEKTNANLEKQFKEVENAQKRMHSLLENASEVISIYNENQKLIYQSPSVANILGYTPEEMIEGKDFERLTSKGQKELATLFERLLEDPSKTITIQYTYMRKDNQKIYIETTGRNFLKDPAIKGIILNSQDITARKKAEKEERMKSKMQALSENSLDMIIRIGLTGKFFYMNPVFETVTGVSVASAINMGMKEVGLNEKIVEAYQKVIAEIKSTVEKANFEFEFPVQDGEYRIMSVDAIPEFNDDKELETILIVAHDITEQKRIEKEITEKNHAITESINYAYRIQTSILPDTKLIREVLPKSFMFYKPRDVVSGDFPWFFKKGDDILIAAVDCTGHGVPGALLSFIGYFLLNNIVDHDDDYTAGEICDKLHSGVRKTLKQDKDDANARDGMDIAFCKINYQKMELQYAGAHRPLYHLRGAEFTEYKGNRKAIGGIPHGKKPEKDFVNYIIPIEIGDKFFFFSDGLPDQVGGLDKRKYQAKRVRDVLVEHNEYTMQAFNSFFKKDFNNWKGENKQIDDVLLIGVEI